MPSLALVKNQYSRTLHDMNDLCTHLAAADAYLALNGMIAKGATDMFAKSSGCIDDGT